MDYMYICCCTLAFILYLNTLYAGFVYDDRRAILNNPDVINSNESWSKLFYNDFWGTNISDPGSHCSYRPLTVLTFKLNHLIGGSNAFGYHLVNVLLHVLATGLVVNLGRHLLPCSISTFLAGLLFASHPIHTESVAGITGRADVIACIFFILSLLSYFHHVQLREKDSMCHHIAMFGSIIFAISAVLCKETAISALIVCIIYDLFKGYKLFCKDRKQLISIAILGIATLLILHFRLSIGHPATPFASADNPTSKAPLMTRFYTFFYLPVFNFYLLLNPQILSFDWSMDSIQKIETFFDQRNLFSLIFYFLTLRLISICIWSHIKLWNCISSSKTDNINSKKKIVTRKRQFDIGARFMKDENKCSVCSVYHKNLKHTNLCIDLNEQTSASLKSIMSLSPLRKYIRSSNYLQKSNDEATTANNNEDDNNNNNINDNDYLDKDSNNNNIVNETESIKPDVGLWQEQVKNPVIAPKKTVAEIQPDKNNERIEKVQRTTAALLSVSILIFPFIPASNIYVYVGFVIAERILYLPSVGFCLLIGLGLERILNVNNKRNQAARNKSYSMQRIKKHFHRRSKIAILSIFATLLVVCMSIRTIKRNLDWRDEESLYKSAVWVNPPKALGNLGSVLSSNEKFELAEIALTTALKFRPNMADVHYNLGILFSKQQKHNQAVRSFHKAIYYRPKLTLAYLNLGTSLISLGKYNEAAVILREGSKLDGNGLRDRRQHDQARISCLVALAKLHTHQKRFNPAIAIYREALASLPAFLMPVTKREIIECINDIFMRLNNLAKNKIKASAKLTKQEKNTDKVCKLINPFTKK